jgi:hypothetical protein
MIALEAIVVESDRPGSLMDSILAGMITQSREFPSSINITY